MVFYWFEDVNLYLVYIDSLIFNNMYKRCPLRDCNEYYAHKITVQIRSSLQPPHKSFSRYLHITERKCLSDKHGVDSRLHDEGFRHSSNVKVITFLP
jgi:hypothetical protein